VRDYTYSRISLGFDLSCGLVFAPFASKDAKAHSLLTLVPQKVVYILCSLLQVALGLWKCRSMGLLPTGTADWLAFESRGEVCPFDLDHGPLICPNDVVMTGT